MKGKEGKRMKSYPLAWPSGWPRTKNRKRAQFRAFGSRVSIATAVGRVFEQLRLLGIPDHQVIVSTNIRPKLDGTPYSGQAEPSDPGVAVYWKKSQDPTHKVMASDRYDKTADNLAALAATLSAMRAIERHGGAQILERAFTGFLALPAPNTWRSVFGYREDEPADLVHVGKVYRHLSRQHHPDHGGSHGKMAELNWAWGEAQKELSQ